MSNADPQLHGGGGADESSSALSILNDHCWLKVFEHLSTSDLANVRATYKSLAFVADMEFNRSTRGSLSFENGHNQNPIEILKQFGPFIKELIFAFEKLRMTWNEIFAAMGEHCTDDLKKLSFWDSSLKSMKQEDILLIANTLKNVEELHLENDEDSGHRRPKTFLHILSHCVKLQRLTIMSVVDVSLYTTIFRNNRSLVKLKWCGPKHSDLVTL